jgi:hypothetical protein
MCALCGCKISEHSRETERLFGRAMACVDVLRNKLDAREDEDDWRMPGKEHMAARQIVQMLIAYPRILKGCTTLAFPNGEMGFDVRIVFDQVLDQEFRRIGIFDE